VGPAIRKSEFLTMAASARFLAIDRHSFVVEEVSAKLHFGGAHWIVSRNYRAGESTREIPIEIGGD
jgi:hypothetical protein